MPTTRVRKLTKTAKRPSKTEKSASRTGKASVTKSERWYFIPTESGGVRRIFRPKGKTSVPRSAIRNAVREVVAKRLNDEANEG